MTNNREEQIYEAANKMTHQTPPQYSELVHKSKKVMSAYEVGFIDGCVWADSHPQWYDAQGDNVPEYGREVIVIRRNGEIGFGHRPNPKEVTMVEGKPYHAKTYDKNGWNWPDIALWLDVEIPHELVEQITDKWFEENEQKRDNRRQI